MLMGLLTTIGQLSVASILYPFDLTDCWRIFDFIFNVVLVFFFLNQCKSHVGKSEEKCCQAISQWLELALPGCRIALCHLCQCCTLEASGWGLCA